MREQGQRLQARKEWPRTDSIHLRNVVNKYESLLKVFFIKKQTFVSLPIWPSSLSQAAFIWFQFSKHNCSWLRLFNPVMGATSDSFRPDPTVRRRREQKRFGAWCSARARVRRRTKGTQSNTISVQWTQTHKSALRAKCLVTISSFLPDLHPRRWSFSREGGRERPKTESCNWKIIFIKQTWIRNKDKTLMHESK